MKAFRNWWNKLLCSNNENFRLVAESSWRECLEHVLSLNLVRIHDDVYEDIKKELEE